MQKITVYIDQDHLFGKGCEIEWYDVDRSMERYADMLYERLSAEFVGCDIEVIDGGSGVKIYGAGSPGVEEDVREEVVLIKSDLYFKSQWVCFTRAGIRNSLDVGLWLNRGNGQRIGVKRIAGGDYAMTFYDGALPPYNVVVYDDAEEVLDIICRLTDLSEWRIASAS